MGVQARIAVTVARIAVNGVAAAGGETDKGESGGRGKHSRHGAGGIKNADKGTAEFLVHGARVVSVVFWQERK